MNIRGSEWIRVDQSGSEWIRVVSSVRYARATVTPKVKGSVARPEPNLELYVHVCDGDVKKKSSNLSECQKDHASCFHTLLLDALGRKSLNLDASL